jgi:hypothetical protein
VGGLVEVGEKLPPLLGIGEGELAAEMAAPDCVVDRRWPGC